MAEELQELSNDELDEIAGGDGLSIGTPIMTRPTKLIRELQSKGLTREQALEQTKDDVHRRWIREYWK